MNYLKEIWMRNPSMLLPVIAHVVKTHYSNVVAAKQPTKIIKHRATINYRNKVASQMKLNPYTSRGLAELYRVDKTIKEGNR